MRCCNWSPQMWKCLWNKAPAIWFPLSLGTLAARAVGAWAVERAGAKASAGLPFVRTVARSFFGFAKRRDCTRARGDERLSGSRKGQSQSAGKSERSPKAGEGDKKRKKNRTGDVGRALRTVYDDTLRESVPDDFLDLLGKLA